MLVGEDMAVGEGGVAVVAVAVARAVSVQSAAQEALVGGVFVVVSVGVGGEVRVFCGQEIV